MNIRIGQIATFTLATTVALMTPLVAHAQDAQSLMMKANDRYAAGEFAESADLYEASIKAGATSPVVHYNAACSSALAGRTESAFKWLRLAVDRGFRDIAMLRSDADLKSLHGDTRWKRVVESTVQAKAAFIRSLAQPALYHELLEMQRVDQQARPDSAAYDPEVDMKNTARMKAIVAMHGWPGKSMVGKAGAKAAWLLVQHADADPGFQRKCLELMKKQPAGEVSPISLAYLKDRVRVNEGKKQVYGTQFHLVDGKYVPRPIEDEANVDRRRKEIGLGTLEEYARMMGRHAD